MFSFVVFLSLGLLLSCEPQKVPIQSIATSTSSMPQTPIAAELTDKVVKFYKQDFPTAVSFRKYDIPSMFLSELDAGNNTYYAVLDKDDAVIGYLREFMGPVTPEDNCACNPLSVTLTFNPDLTVRNVMSVNPLQKYGHEPLTDAEHEQMVSIVQNPSEALLSLLAPQDMIDGVSGATNLTYKDKVVDKAGFSSWRLSTLAIDTVQIIEGAPKQRDADLLRGMLQTAETDADKRRIVAEFVPLAESTYLRMRALSVLADLYIQTLMETGFVDEQTENTLLNSGLGAHQEAEMLLNECHKFLHKKVGLSFASKCIEALEANPQHSKFESEIQILKGLTLAAQGLFDEALPTLEQGLSSAPPSPALRQKLATLYKENNQMDKYCDQIKELYIDAPRWPNIEALLSTCGEAGELQTQLQQSRRQAIVEMKIANPKRMSPLTLVNEAGEQRLVDSTKKVSVLVFFATWCPHCQMEMTTLNAFYAQLQASEWKDVVELVAVRTAISREYQTLASFKEEYQVQFPILTDEGLQFESFAAEQDIRPAYPTIAIADQEGHIVYFPLRSQYNEPVQELFWMIESLVGSVK